MLSIIKYNDVNNRTLEWNLQAFYGSNNKSDLAQIYQAIRQDCGNQYMRKWPPSDNCSLEYTPFHVSHYWQRNKEGHDHDEAGIKTQNIN